MDIQFVYQKKRSEFGRQCLFVDRGPEVIDDYPGDKRLLREYILRDPVHTSTQCAPLQAQHFLNTTRAEYSSVGMNHFEGGWPKDININDEEQTKRYRRKVEKDESFCQTMMQLFNNVENCVLQNNAINIYQQYFSDLETLPNVEKSSARTVNVFQDQSSPSRPVTNISWSPDNQSKIACAHCLLDFQADLSKTTTHSYIWEVENPNRPLYTLKPVSPITSLEYNQKDPNLVASGHLNGQVAFWDLRKGIDPIEYNVMETSFRDPVRNVLWIASKSGTEFFSSSTDGQIKWWDTRKMSEPTETLILDFAKDEDQKLTNAMGASCLEYEHTIPTRFTVGTEQGYVISGNRKGKTALEKMPLKYSAHIGPVLSVQRNPGFLKILLTVGDWSTKIFSEDCKESYIMWTRFHKASLTGAAWSPTRLSVYYTARSDGVLDVWDILQSQKQAILGVKICDETLNCLRANDMGRLIAVGTAKGTVYLVEISENLSVSSKNDKNLLNAMFDRETKREKILEARNREVRLKAKAKSNTQLEEPGVEGEQEGEMEEQLLDLTESELWFKDKNLAQLEEEFFNLVNPPKKEDKPKAGYSDEEEDG